MQPRILTLLWMPLAVSGESFFLTKQSSGSQVVGTRDLMDESVYGHPTIDGGSIEAHSTTPEPANYSQHEIPSFSVKRWRPASLADSVLRAGLRNLLGRMDENACCSV